MKTIKFNIIALAITAITFLSSAQTDHNNAATDKVNRSFVNYLFDETIATNGIDGSLIKSTDNGTFWNQQTLFSNTDHFVTVNDFDQFDINSTGVAVGNSGEYYVTTDAGQTFTRYELEVQKKINKIASLSPIKYLLCGDNGLCKYSYDGTRWEDVWFGVKDQTENFIDIAKIDNEIAFIMSATNLYLIQYGRCEQQSAFDMPSKVNAIAMTDLVNGYIAGNNCLFASTTDRGNTWQEITAPNYPPLLPFDLKDVSVRRDGLVYAVGTKGTIVILNTSDNSLSYKQLEIESEDGKIEVESRDLTSIEFKDENEGMIVGKEGAAFITHDGGATWTKVLFDDGGDRPSNPLRNKETKKENTVISQNFPNPFNPSTRISFTLPSDSKVSIKVYDLTGREVRTLVNDFRSAGSYSVEFNAGNLSSGVYFYTLVANGITDTKRMILTK